MFVLDVARFGCSARSRVVLERVDLSLVAGEAVALLGAAGSGKSMFLRIVAGRRDDTIEHWGTLDVSKRVAFVQQRVRPRAGQPTDRSAVEHLARVREALRQDVELVCLDEPTAGLDGFTRAQVLQAIRHRARDRAVLYVTHNRRDALVLGGRVALIADGRIAEIATAEQFFRNPMSEYARCYVRTGSCPCPARAMPGQELGPTRARVLRLAWVIPGIIAGCARPGLLGDEHVDLARLRDAGVRTLVCLEERDPIAASTLFELGIEKIALPITDMTAPSIADAVELCSRIEQAIATRGPVAVHCRAGLGRTGTVLTAYLTWRFRIGFAEALARARDIDPQFVQSPAQLEFLMRFADACLNNQPEGNTRKCPSIVP